MPIIPAAIATAPGLAKLAAAMGAWAFAHFYAAPRIGGATATAKMAENMQAQAMQDLLLELDADENWRQERERRTPPIAQRHMAQMSLLETGGHPAQAPLADLYSRSPVGSLAESVNEQLGTDTVEMRSRLGATRSVEDVLSQ